MVALAGVWQAAGVAPDAVAGHSQGEIAAACVAGVLSVEDAAKVVALRSRALGVLAGRGTMAWIAAPAAQVEAGLAGWAGQVTVAAVNGPAETVISGDRDGAEEATARCAARGWRGRPLPAGCASPRAQREGPAEPITAAR